MDFIKEELAWSAGFFDGEGSTTASHNYRRINMATLTITQTEREPLERFQRATGGFGAIYLYTRKDGAKPQFIWRVSRFEHVQAVVAMLWNYLCQPKRDQILRVFRDVHSRRLVWMADLPINSKHKTHCLRGHEYTEANTRRYANKRHCKKCAFDGQRLRRGKHGIS